MTPLKYVIADVFTDRPLYGNPVAVFLNADGLPTEKMQRLAAELNLSETVFVTARPQQSAFEIRIFTPVNELPFAGHPVLGTATVLADLHGLEDITLVTVKAPIQLSVTRTEGGTVSGARMAQPMPTWSACEDRDIVLAALGVTDVIAPVEIYDIGPRHIFVGVESISELSAIRPNLISLAALPNVAVNCFAADAGEWRSRMFSPAYGVSEDAATGSAAGPLGIHLIRHGFCKPNQPIVINQGVEMGRHSKMKAFIETRDTLISAIYVEGGAVIVARGAFLNCR